MDVTFDPAVSFLDLGRYEPLGTHVSAVRHVGDDLRSRGDLGMEDVRPTLLEIAARRGIKPIQSIDELRGDFWPEDDNLDDFLQERSHRRGGNDKEGSP